MLHVVNFLICSLPVNRYDDKLLVHFILSPLKTNRKEANNGGRISEQYTLLLRAVFTNFFKPFRSIHRFLLSFLHKLSKVCVGSFSLYIQGY